ncbi:MAG TPA: CbiX/SirB N-terminal domain-containing protein [Kineosporiaceae bacterium]
MRTPTHDPALPALIACGHGTRGPAGRRALARLRLDVAALRPGLQVVAASVDVQKPALPDVVARLADAGRRCVVVPLLLAAGYHVRVDVAGAVARSHGLAVASAALGPDPALVDVLVERLAECGQQEGDTLVLGAAGSADPTAVAEVERVSRDLATRLGRPVTTGYLSGAAPSVPDAVRDARTAGRPVTLATFLLSPGYFADLLATTAGADRTSAPLAPHPALAGLVLRRYDAALTRPVAP